MSVAARESGAMMAAANAEATALRGVWAGRAALAGSCVAVLGMTFWAYRHFIAMHWLPLWDESWYYMTAVRIWHALHSGNLNAAGRETWNYHLAIGMPFLAPYFLVLGLMIGGTSLEAARAGSLIAGLLGCGAVAWLAATLAGERKAYAAAVAAVLWGTSPMFLFYSSRAQYESFSMLFTVLCLVAAARFAERGGRLAAAATGMCASLVFLTKYNVGVLLMAGLFLGLAWPEIRKRLVADPRGLLEQVTRPWILLVATAIVPVALWLMAGEVRLFMNFLKGFPYDAMDLGAQFLFFPRSFFQEYMAVPLLGVLVLAGVAYWSLKGWGEPGIRVALVCGWLNVFGAVLHTTKDGRYIWGSVALATALTGAFVAREMPRWPRWQKVPASIAVALGLVWSVWAAPAAAQTFFSRNQTAPTAEQQRALEGALQFIRANTQPGQAIFVTGVADYGINLNMIRQFLANPVTGAEGDIQALPCPVTAPAWGYPTEPSPLYAQLLREQFVKTPGASLVVLDHEAGSPYRGRLYPWIFSWQENYQQAAGDVAGLQNVAALDTHTGLRLTVYRLVQGQKPALP